MRAAAVAILIFLSFFLSSGALGLKTVEECQNDPNLRDSQEMQCYHLAAVTTAYICGPLPSSEYGPCGKAYSTCMEIFTRWGSDSSKSMDLRRKAELISNNCFYDIAKITRNADTCNGISQHLGTPGESLLGSEVTYDMCREETERLAQMDPDNYWTSGKDTICSIVFVLPVLFVGAILSRGP